LEPINPDSRVRGGVVMSNSGGPAQDESIPVMQRILDNPFLLLFLGVVIPTVSYTIWGIMEVITIPLANY
jgi:hypothetical protein